MNVAVSSMLYPYLSLGLLVFGLFVVRSINLLSFLLALIFVFAFVNDIIDPMGLFAMAAFWGICTLHWRNPSKCEGANTLRVFLLAAIAIAFASHMIPGFHNLRVYEGILVSPTSMPFTMYLNFDKTTAAIILALSSGLILRKYNSFGLKTWRDTLFIGALAVIVLSPLAVFSGYVKFDPKIPDIFGLWTFNNLLFVCFAEEIIFRGVIQNQLMHFVNRWNLHPMVPILISSLLFAVTLPGHRANGLLFMGFATLAGMFYGYAYHRTKRIESAILVHFIVNLSHFLLFSYPMAANLIK
jgi:hypothetical protein